MSRATTLKKSLRFVFAGLAVAGIALAINPALNLFVSDELVLRDALNMRADHNGAPNFVGQNRADIIGTIPREARVRILEVRYMPRTANYGIKVYWPHGAPNPPYNPSTKPEQQVFWLYYDLGSPRVQLDCATRIENLPRGVQATAAQPLRTDVSQPDCDDSVEALRELEGRRTTVRGRLGASSPLEELAVLRRHLTGRTARTITDLSGVPERTVVILANNGCIENTTEVLGLSDGFRGPIRADRAYVSERCNWGCVERQFINPADTCTVGTPVMPFCSAGHDIDSTSGQLRGLLRTAARPNCSCSDIVDGFRDGPRALQVSEANGNPEGYYCKTPPTLSGSVAEVEGPACSTQYQLAPSGQLVGLSVGAPQPVCACTGVSGAFADGPRCLAGAGARGNPDGYYCRAPDLVSGGIVQLGAEQCTTAYGVDAETGRVLNLLETHPRPTCACPAAAHAGQEVFTVPSAWIRETATPGYYCREAPVLVATVNDNTCSPMYRDTGRVPTEIATRPNSCTCPSDDAISGPEFRTGQFPSLFENTAVPGYYCRTPQPLPEILQSCGAEYYDNRRGRSQACACGYDGDRVIQPERMGVFGDEFTCQRTAAVQQVIPDERCDLDDYGVVTGPRDRACRCPTGGRFGNSNWVRMADFFPGPSTGGARVCYQQNVPQPCLVSGQQVYWQTGVQQCQCPGGAGLIGRGGSCGTVASGNQVSVVVMPAQQGQGALQTGVVSSPGGGVTVVETPVRGPVTGSIVSGTPFTCPAGDFVTGTAPNYQCVPQSLVRPSGGPLVGPTGDLIRLNQPWNGTGAPIGDSFPGAVRDGYVYYDPLRRATDVTTVGDVKPPVYTGAALQDVSNSCGNAVMISLSNLSNAVAPTCSNASTSYGVVFRSASGVFQQFCSATFLPDREPPASARDGVIFSPGTGIRREVLIDDRCNVYSRARERMTDRSALLEWPGVDIEPDSGDASPPTFRQGLQDCPEGRRQLVYAADRSITGYRQVCIEENAPMNQGTVPGLVDGWVWDPETGERRSIRVAPDQERLYSIDVPVTGLSGVATDPPPRDLNQVFTRPDAIATVSRQRVDAGAGQASADFFSEANKDVNCGTQNGILSGQGGLFNNDDNVRHSDTLGWGMTFGMADLLSFKHGRQVSAMDLSIRAHGRNQARYDDFMANNPLWTDPVAAYRRILSTSGDRLEVCLESDFRSDDYAFSQAVSDNVRGNRTAQAVLAAAADFFNAYNANYSTTWQNLPDKEKFCSDLEAVHQGLFRGMGIREILESAREARGQNTETHLSNRFIQLLRDAKCNPQRIDAGEPVPSTDIAALNQQITAGNPVVMMVDLNVISNQATHDGRYRRNVSGSTTALTIVGREWKGGKCVYKVRTNWGPSSGEVCTYYNTTNVSGCPSDNGTIEVSAEAIRAAGVSTGFYFP